MRDLLKNALIGTLERMKFKNLYTPFPLIDTEHINMLENKIEKGRYNLDEEPVECCKHCKSLYLVSDDHENVTCAVCNNSINETEKHKNIKSYLEKYEGEETGDNKD